MCLICYKDSHIMGRFLYYYFFEQSANLFNNCFIHSGNTDGLLSARHGLWMPCLGHEHNPKILACQGVYNLVSKINNKTKPIKKIYVRLSQMLRI